SALRMWLQEALQIHPRLAFRSAVEAQRSFADINSRPGSRRAGAMALQVLVRTTCGEPLDQLRVVLNPPMQAPAAQAPPQAPPPQERLSAFDSILRSVLPKH
ncbi:MAG TPA: hypothetical protein VEP46_05935, partial [Vicinamibacterales bacterium]|nr:hypothetical protein [Vicinamibacterales bacterium]